MKKKYLTRKERKAIVDSLSPEDKARYETSIAEVIFTVIGVLIACAILVNLREFLL